MEQQRHIDPKRPGDLVDRVDRRIADAAFDLADEFVTQARPLAQSFLRPSALLPPIAHSRTQPGLYVTHARSIQGVYSRKNPPKTTAE